MRSLRTRVACVPLVAASLFVASGYADAEVPSGDFPSVEQLPAACRAAKADFRPLTKEDLQQVKAELTAALARLDEKLTAEGENGENWRKYVLWDKLQEQLGSEKGPDLDALQAVRKRYAADHEGLALAWFLDVKEALWRYRYVAASINNPGAKAAYEKVLDSLADHLKSYAAGPSAEEALAIGGAVGELQGELQNARQAPDLVAAIAHHFAQPNLFVQISAHVITSGLAEDVDDTAPVEDVILGTCIRGTGHTVGKTTGALVADDRRAVIDVTFLGTNRSENVGTNRSVRIYSNAITGIAARKRLWVDADGFHSLPSVANAVIETEITGIQAGALATRIAWRQAGRQKQQAQQIAARHAEERINRRIDAEAAKTIGEANEKYVRQIRNPLTRRRLFPERLDFSTTAESLKVVVLERRRSQLAAPSGAPPKLVEQTDVALWMHESAINNAVAAALAGRTLHDETLATILTDLLGELPEEFKRNEDQDPWAIKFVAQKPITVKFADNGFVAVVRGDRYQRGEESYPGMNVTAAYKFAKTEKGFTAVRQGDLQILPPDFTARKVKKLKYLEVGARTLLKRRFGMIFKPEMPVEDIELAEPWNKAGKMRPVQVVSEKAWLAIAWRHDAE